MLDMLGHEHLALGAAALDKEEAAGSRSVFRVAANGAPGHDDLAAVKGKVFRYAADKEAARLAAAVDEAAAALSASGSDGGVDGVLEDESFDFSGVLGLDAENL